MQIPLFLAMNTVVIMVNIATWKFTIVNQIMEAGVSLNVGDKHQRYINLIRIPKIDDMNLMRHLHGSYLQFTNLGLKSYLISFHSAGYLLVNPCPRIQRANVFLQEYNGDNNTNSNEMIVNVNFSVHYFYFKIYCY